MPKVQNAEGKLYTDHKIGNPFDNFAQTCANCHTQDKAALQQVVAERKQSINDLKSRLKINWFTLTSKRKQRWMQARRKLK